MPLKMFPSTESLPSKKIKKIIAVAAGKGGVGKSTVTINLGLALQKAGYQVGILDADIYGPSVRKMLPEEEKPLQKGQGIVPAVCRGIKMISMAYFRREGEASVVRAPIATSIITQFIKNVDWGDLDYLLIDFPPGTGDVQLTLSQQANLNGALMVTTPQEVSLLDVRKAIHMFDQVNVPVVGVVENMSYYKHEKTGELLHLFGKGGGERLAKEACIPLLGQIPIDPLISQCGDQGSSLLSHDCQASQAFQELGKKLKEALLTLERNVGLDQFDLGWKDSHTLTLTWRDGTCGEYRLSDLQKSCPCANCTDEITGKRLLDESTIDKDVKATKIGVVGRYALRIEFTSGCSTGLYELANLHKMALNVS